MSNKKAVTAPNKADKKAKATKKEVVVKDDKKAVSASFMSELEAHASNSVHPEMDADDFAIPRLNILQLLSPQCIETDDLYVKGAKAGMIYNTVSGDLYKGGDGLSVLPIQYRRAYIEWKDRDVGGGIVKDHGRNKEIFDLCTQNDKGKWITAEKNVVVTTAEYIVLFRQNDKDDYIPAVISMTSTQIKTAKRWNTMMSQLKMLDLKGVQLRDAEGLPQKSPLFWRNYTMKTIPQSNQSGTWFGWVINPLHHFLAIDGAEQIYKLIKVFQDKIDAGDVNIAPQTPEDVVENDKNPI